MRAVDAVVAAERALGRIPEVQPHNNPGFDIRSWDPAAGTLVFIEVKGRVEGAEELLGDQDRGAARQERRPLPARPGLLVDMRLRQPMRYAT